MHATAFLQPITWNRVSATSSLVIVEPSLEHDVHSRSASVWTLCLSPAFERSSTLSTSPTHAYCNPPYHQGGDLKETKRPPTSLVRGSTGTDVARLHNWYILFFLLSSTSTLWPSPSPSPLGPCHYLVPLASTSTHPPLVQRYEYQRPPLWVPITFLQSPLMIFTHLCPHPALHPRSS